MQFKSFEVTFSLHVFDDLLSVTQHLSLQLHATQLDNGACRHVLDGVQKTNDKRTDHGFEQVFAVYAVKFANKNEVSLPSTSCKRTVRVSTQTNNSVGLIMSAIGHKLAASY